ncbi:Hypothetical predicted protein, partial [Podarcis lilfordi]
TKRIPLSAEQLGTCIFRWLFLPTGRVFLLMLRGERYFPKYHAVRRHKHVSNIQALLQGFHVMANLW